MLVWRQASTWPITIQWWGSKWLPILQPLTRVFWWKVWKDIPRNASEISCLLRWLKKVAFTTITRIIGSCTLFFRSRIRMKQPRPRLWLKVALTRSSHYPNHSHKHSRYPSMTTRIPNPISKASLLRISRTSTLTLNPSCSQSEVPPRLHWRLNFCSSIGSVPYSRKSNRCAWSTNIWRIVCSIWLTRTSSSKSNSSFIRMQMRTKPVISVLRSTLSYYRTRSTTWRRLMNSKMSRSETRQQCLRRNVLCATLQKARQPEVVANLNFAPT